MVTTRAVRAIVPLLVLAILYIFMAADNHVIDTNDPFNAKYYEIDNTDDEREWRTIWKWPDCCWHWEMRYEPPFDEIFLKEELTQKGLKTICRTWGLNPIGNKMELIRTILKSAQNKNLLRAQRIADQERADASNRDNISQRMSGERGSPATPENENEENEQEEQGGDESKKQEENDTTASSNNSAQITTAPQQQQPDRNVTFAPVDNTGSIDGSQGSQREQRSYRYDGNHNIPPQGNNNAQRDRARARRQDAHRITVTRDGVDRARQTARNSQQ